MKTIVFLLILMLFLASCATTGSGGAPIESFEVYKVMLKDGRQLECISSNTYGEKGVLDCNWEALTE